MEQVTTSLDDYFHTIEVLPCACCIVRLDETLTIQKMNQKMCDLFGFLDSRESRSLKDELFEKDFHQMLEVLDEAGTYHREHVRFTTSYLLNEQTFYFAYEGILLKDEMVLTITDITAYRDLELELNYMHQQHEILMQQTGHISTHYEIATKTLYQPKEAARRFNLPSIMENVPYSTVGLIIAEESKKDYIKLYTSMLEGVPHGEKTIRIYVNHAYAWYVMRYDLIYDDEKKPIRSIISYEDITDLQEKELAYKKWQNYFQLQQEQSIAYYEYNLTKDEFLIREIEDPAIQKEDVTFFELTTYIAQHRISEENREEYLNIFSRQRLLSEFYAGEREYRFEHQRMKDDGSSYWTLAIIQLVSDPYTDDIMASILIKDINDEKESLFQLLQLSRIDPLTGLLNRTTMIAEADDLFQCSTIAESHVLLMIDLDNFKYLNDSMGHKFGDQVLLNVAKELRRTVRAGDLCARIGGDEFVVLLKYTAIDNQLLQRVEALHHGINWVYGSIQISTSIGLSIFPCDGWTFDDLYQKADIAMYEAKKNGRNQFSVYTSCYNEQE